MAKREELLTLLDGKNGEDVIKFVKQYSVGNANCINEILESCSKKQLDLIWESLFNIYSPDLNVDRVLNEETCSKVLDIIQCITSVLNGMISQKDVYIPDTMLHIVTILQEILPSIPSSNDKIKNNLCKVYEEWWRKNLPNKECIIITSFLYILERSLDLQPKPLIGDVKRVWSLHELVLLLDLDNTSSDYFKTLIQRCYIAPQYINHDEGIKFLGFMMTVHGDFCSVIHSTIKNHLMSVPRHLTELALSGVIFQYVHFQHVTLYRYAGLPFFRSWSVKYGEIYFRAWQSGCLTKKMEEHCIQDLMAHAVHAQPSLAPCLRKLLGYIHERKKLRGVDNMLYRMYAPILWRSLTVANHHVRENAAALLFDVFPVQNPDLTLPESDSLLQKQFDMMRELLDDPVASVRKCCVLGVFGIMKTYWEVIPQDVLKYLTLKLVQDMLKDASSANVREAVVKGLIKLLDNPLCHPFLKPILATIRNSFHDISENVRIAMLELLLKVKCLRTLKYWHIVPIEHLLSRLVVDSDPVNKRIMKLIFSSFIPLDVDREDQLDRCITLIESNLAAARKVYMYAPQYMSLEDTVRYISMLCVAVLKFINTSDDKQSDSTDDNDEGVEKGDRIITKSNRIVMRGLIEAICCLWTVIENQLSKASNAQLNKQLLKKFSYALPEMMEAFTDPDIVHALMQIAAFLPPSFVPTLSRTWLPKLRKMTSESTEDDFLNIFLPMCKNGRAGDILELIIDWITPTFENENPEPTDSEKKTKSKKKVGFIEERLPEPKLGLDMLCFILTDPVTQEYILTDHVQDCVVLKNLLHGSLRLTEKNLSSYNTTEVDIVLSSFTVYCKLSLLMYIKNKSDNDCKRELEDILDWADKCITPVLDSKLDSDSKVKNLAVDITRILMKVLNDMLLVGVGDTSICINIVDYCMTCLSLDEDLELLPLIMLCIYQVSECMQYSTESDTDVFNKIPSALSQLMLMIARYVRHNQETSHKLLGSVKTHFTEMLKASYQHLCLDSTLLHDVMGTILAAMIAEVAVYSQKDDLGNDVTELPPLSHWLLDILAKKSVMFRHFVDELTSCCESGACNNIYRLHGALFVLYIVMKDKKQKTGLKDLFNILKIQYDKMKHEFSTEQTQDYRSVIEAIDDRFSVCQRHLNIVQ